jgi:hypothetical protein
MKLQNRKRVFVGILALVLVAPVGAAEWITSWSAAPMAS